MAASSMDYSHGTGNLGPRPRIMANGMVRVKKEAFESRGCTLLAKESLISSRPNFEPRVVDVASSRIGDCSYPQWTEARRRNVRSSLA